MDPSGAKYLLTLKMQKISKISSLRRQRLHQACLTLQLKASHSFLLNSQQMLAKSAASFTTARLEDSNPLLLKNVSNLKLRNFQSGLIYRQYLISTLCLSPKAIFH